MTMRNTSRCLILMSVTRKELDALLSGKIDLLLRKSYPVNAAAYPLEIYFVLKGSSGEVLAKASCPFIMHTIGIDSELKRSGITGEQFEKRYTKTYSFPDGDYQHADALAWTITNISPVSLKLSDFLQIVVRKFNKLTTIDKVPKGWIYVVRTA